MPLSRGLAGIVPWLGTGLAATAVVGATALAWIPAAEADVDSFYSATARSVFVDGYFSNQTIPGGVRPEGGGPQTDVSQSSLDKGDATANFPYFGDFVATAPGVVSGLFGVPVPPYPLTASSTFGGAPASVNYPGIALNANSRANSTVADAVVGSAGSGATSHSEVDETADGTVTAAASNSSPLTVLGPLVSLKGFDSSVVVSADSNGTLTRTSNFAISQISVPGVVLRIPEGSPSSFPVPFPVPIPGVPAPAPIPAPPLPVPAPFAGATITEPKIGFINGFFTVSLPFAGETQQYALPAEPVLQAFSAQGVTVRYTAPQKTEAGLFGGVFTVQYTIPAPPDNPFYSGPTPATFIVGNAEAAVTRAADNPVIAAGGAAGTVGTAVGAADGSLPAGTDGIAAPANLGAGALPGAVDSSGVPTVNLVPQASGDGSSGLGAALVSAGLPAFLSSDFSAIYLALIGIAAIALLAVAVLGSKGVSARWNS